jgi:hypothetical protein
VLVVARLSLLYAITEQITQKDIDTLVAALGTVAA